MDIRVFFCLFLRAEGSAGILSCASCNIASLFPWILLPRQILFLAHPDRLFNQRFYNYTIHELLDELDVIECFTEPGKAEILGEVLKKQEQIYRALGVTPLLAKPEIS